MGQTLMTLAQGSGQNREKELGSTIEDCYDKYFAEKSKDLTLSDFYGAVCQTVEDINKKLNSTQFRVPEADKLKEVYQIHYKDKGKSLTKEEFQKILQEIIMHTGFTGFGSKDILIFLYGIPAAALFIKQRVAPKAIPNDVFIPGITSASVFLLAKLNKI
ncbi:hypothetical protein P3X46_004668 [Hevea brasiliensis]|uniref:Uncharacterized protein n=2 Tax=Hevea brasiliensis TaxID=3981 RepID=A0ABQ9N0A7_HEVBR|nr:uncharacterized protein LOC110671470 [Hevea brasiliensis]KAF2308259.1 hypothetical protein GH714_039584 [Hevea brasiliensis]KAJ9184986.1 hypothetical protein P3X46_004668 [Hevea brasiliensis]